MDSTEPLTVRSRAAVATLLLLGSLALFAIAAPAGLTNGDAAVYAQQMKSGNFSDRSVHLGYYIIGAFVALLSPDFSDYALNLISCFFGAATVALLYLLAADISRSHLVGGLAGLCFVTNYTLFENCAYAEIYIVETCFLVLALYLWLREQAVASGVAFAAATLVTPSAMLAVPGFVVLRPSLRPLVRMALAGSAVLVVALTPVLDDYLFGPRGLLGAAEGGVDLVAAVKKEAFETVFGFFALLPFVAAGAVEAVRKPQWRRFATALFVFWLVAFALGERFGDVPVQLPTYALLTVLAGLGCRRALLADAGGGAGAGGRVALLVAAALVPVALLVLARPWAGSLRELPPALPAVLAAVLLGAAALAVLAARSGRLRPMPVMLVACLAVNSGLVFCFVEVENREVEGFRDTVLAAGEAADPSYVMVGTWSRGILFEHYLTGESYTERYLNLAWLEGTWGEKRRQEAEERWRQAVSSGSEIWLLGEYDELFDELQAHGYTVSPFREIYRARHDSGSQSPRSPTS